MLFDEGDDKMVKTEAFPTIRMKIDRLLKITNEYQFNDLVKAVYCINLCINNRSVLESCLALNACLIEYEEKGSKRIGTYDEFKGFFGKIYDVMKPGIADDYTVEDFGEVQLRYNDKFYRVIIGTGHNNVYACLNFLPTLARNISREEELCLALEYVSGTIDYFIEENKNDGVVEKRFVLPTEILFYKVQKFFKEEVKKYDILELDSLMMSEGTTIEKSHFVCREDNIYPLYNVSLLIDLYDIWENKIDFKEQISVANEGIIDRIYSLFEMDRSRSCSIFAPAMIFPEQKYDSSQRTYTFIAKASRGVVVAIFVLMNSLFSIRKKANKYTGEQVKKLIQDGKYIPGVFVELNNSKEVLRYFVYGKKWRKRLIKNFNYVYDNSYGEILKKACDNQNVCFRLNRMASTKKILETVNSAYEFHNNFRNSGIEFKQDYKESQILFEIIQYPYNEILGSLLKYSKVANGKYLILTGSAGNGKTNLLCSISELLVNLKQTTIFLNAREIEGDILDFIFDELGLPDLYKKHKEIYLYLVNLLLTVQNKFLFIIVDAINENDSDGFGNQISAFINKIADYSRAKIVVSCRNEYYKERFRKYLVEKVNIPVFEFDLKEQHYTSTAINRIIKTYSNHFNYSGNISLAVKSVLSEQLLLLRIFFEVNKDSNADVYSIRKHEIFAQYIEKLKQNNREYLETVLDTVTDFMIHSDNYDEISITDLEKTGITSGDIRKTVNSGILLSKKLVFHEGTIARNEKEVVYFVFDEMRDYCLARQILLNNISAYNVDGESVIEKLKQLKATGASCTEGVIHYCYVFFKTDELVSKLGQTEKMCNSILDLYRIPEGGERKSYWSMRYREELQNLGLRIILTSGLELTDFEITYIQDCLRKDPYEDGGMFFDTMLDGTLYGGIYNLDIYLGILFGLKNKDAILNTFHTISARNNMDDRFIPEDFIKYYNELSDSERKLQIQKIAELFLLCFKLHDKDKQEELEDFFYNLPTHDKVQNDMILEMRIACGLEVKDYE